MHGKILLAAVVGVFAVLASVSALSAQPLLCDPEPPSSVPRPIWQELAPPDGSGYPDYIDVTHNLQVANSIRLLASIATRAAESLQNLSSKVEDPETEGRCVCSPTDIHQNVKRKDCNASSQTFPCSGQLQSGYPLWLPTDLFKDKNQTVLFTLKLIGFLDKIETLLEKIQNDPNVSALAQALQQLGTKLDNLEALIDEYQDYVDLLTEGYHLGGYSTERPDLHLCVGYGGHGAFAQMLNLFGEVSIGSRYTSDNLSREDRAQFRSGGFGVTAFGHTLSILPGLEANLQMDGFKLWDAQKPFGINVPDVGVCPPSPCIPNTDACCDGCGFPLADIDKYDIFHLADPNDVAGFDTSGDGCLQPGEFLIHDFYPATYLSAADATSHTWPRSPFDTYDWERQNTAVFGAGLNFDPKLKRIEKKIPPNGIVLFPGATLFPKLTLDAGAEWKHKVNDLRERLKDAINKNLPAALQLTADDFERPMHFLQAPDLSADDTSSAYVRPRITADLVIGIALAKYLTLGITATIGTSVRIEPQGHGGVHDLNVALTDTLLHSNPPPDLPCDPIIEANQTIRCSNELFLDDQGDPLSSGDYSCDTTQVVIYHCKDPEGGSCQPAKAEKDCPLTGECVPEYGCAAHGYCERYLGPGPDGKEGTEDDVIDVQHDTTYGACIGEAVCDDAAVNAGAACKEDADCIGQGACDAGVNPGHACMTNDDCTRGECVHPSAPCVVVSPVGYFTPYQCLIGTNPEITGWQGPGCHPLTVGFPSACGCQGDGDCASGETCAGGTCESAGQPVPCDCDPGNSTCTAGRICVEGGCLLACSVDGDCGTNQTCRNGACVNPYGIPFAEQIVWQVSHTQKPQHAVSTYAQSDIVASALLDAGLWVGLDLKILKKLYHFDVFKVAQYWPLGNPTNKTWYQGGLEARYQNDCDPAGGNTVTNWQPEDQRVTRYPAPLPATPAYGNAGTEADLLQWCLPELQSKAGNPDAPDEGDLGGALTDIVHFGEDVGVDVWSLGGLCVTQESDHGLVSEPFNQWVGDLSSISGVSCSYTYNSQTSVFPCHDLRKQLLLTWGCLDVSASPWAAILAAHFDGANDPLDIDTTFHSTPVLDLDAMLVDPTAELTLDNLKAQIRNYQLFTGAYWYSAVTQCWETHYAQVQPGDLGLVGVQVGPCCGNGVLDRSGCDDGPGGTPCEGCDDGNTVPGDGCNAICQTEGRPRPLGCGDGILQAGFGEQCDDGNQTSGDGCEADCTLTEKVASPTATVTATATPTPSVTQSPSPTSTCSEPHSVFVSTGRNAVSVGGDDPVWSLTAVPTGASFSPPGPATVISPNAAWTTLPDTQWISANTGCTVTFPMSGCPAGVYRYELCWEQCGALVDVGPFMILADNSASVSLDGIPIATTPSPGFATATSFSFNPNPGPGMHRLRVDVVNDPLGSSQTATGMDFRGTLSGQVSIVPCREEPPSTATPTVSVSPTATRTRIVTFPGDANCDGHLDAADPQAAASAPFDPIERARCDSDCNGDGTVTIADTTCVIRLLGT